MKWEVITNEPVTTVDTLGRVEIAGYKKEIVEAEKIHATEGVIFLSTGVRPIAVYSVRNLVSIKFMGFD